MVQVKRFVQVSAGRLFFSRGSLCSEQSQILRYVNVFNFSEVKGAERYITDERWGCGMTMHFNIWKMLLFGISWMLGKGHGDGQVEITLTLHLVISIFDYKYFFILTSTH